jgi:hypothetical protein
VVNKKDPLGVSFMTQTHVHAGRVNIFLNTVGIQDFGESRVAELCAGVKIRFNQRKKPMGLDTSSAPVTFIQLIIQHSDIFCQVKIWIFFHKL